MIHLVVRLPVPYQRTLCRTLHDRFDGAFSAWFHERTNAEVPCEPDRDERFTAQYLTEVGYYKFLRALMSDPEPVIILGGWSSPMTLRTLLFATVLRVPILIWADHPHPRERSWAQHRIRRAWLRSISLLVRGFLACGSPTAEHLVTLGIPAHKITTFPYWVEVPERWPLPERETDSADRLLRLAAVGRQVPVKQFQVAIEAVACANRNGKCVEMVLAGDGPERGRLESLANSLGCADSVSFTGWLENEAVYHELSRVDALILTSKFDAYGVVVLEAMALGRPVLASDGVIAAVDRGDDGGVFLHANGDVEALASQIQKLAMDHELLLAASRAARATAEKWRPERAGAILAEVLKNKRVTTGDFAPIPATNPQTPNAPMGGNS